MKRYLVLYMAPASVLADWMKTDPETRKQEEEVMKAEWNAWMEKHGSALTETAGAGKTKRVTKEGVQDVANDIMLYSIVEAESDEAAAKMFEGHPHLAIPGATIEVMPSNALNEM